jgi:hypothetical protein
MATLLDSRNILMFDYFAEFAQPFRESIRAHAGLVAAREGRGGRIYRESEGIPQGGSYSTDRSQAAATIQDWFTSFSVMDLFSSYRP